MDIKKGSRIAVIGAGISGIAATNILKKNGFMPIVFEKSQKLGGVWSTAYPEVHLQNIYTQYHLSDFSWPFKPDLHPTGKQIMRYLTAAVEHLKLEIRLRHEVLERKRPAGFFQLSLFSSPTCGTVHSIDNLNLPPPHPRTFRQDDEPILAHPIGHVRAEEESGQINCFFQRLELVVGSDPFVLEPVIVQPLIR